MAGMSAAPSVRYYAWAPGAWQLPSTASDDGILVEVVEVACAYCGELRLLPHVDPDTAGYDEAETERFLREAREHWEDHLAPVREPVEYFHLPGIGNVKFRDSGTWTEILLTVPYLLMDGDRLPPPAVVR